MGCASSSSVPTVTTTYRSYPAQRQGYVQQQQFGLQKTVVTLAPPRQQIFIPLSQSAPVVQSQPPQPIATPQQYVQQQQYGMQRTVVPSAQPMQPLLIPPPQSAPVVQSQPPQPIATPQQYVQQQQYGMQETVVPSEPMQPLLIPPPQSAPVVQSQPPQPIATPQQNVNVQEELKKFQFLQALIINLEKKSIVMKLEDKTKQKRIAEQEIQALKTEYYGLTKKMNKELQDVTKLKEMANSSPISHFFSLQMSYDEQFSKEETEYIQAKTELENCYNKMLSLEQENSRVSAELDELKRDRNELLRLYGEVDGTLEAVFGGVYGSALEDVLEQKFDATDDKLRKIKSTMTNWKNAQVMTKAATDQLNVACSRWFDVERIPKSGNYQQLRTHRISEAKNYLLAASRNLTHTQRNVDPVKLPYCDPQEILVLNQAINFIFLDGMSRERHAHAYHVYRATLTRAMMLSQWIEKVITEKLNLDLSECRKAHGECRLALRKERLRLMKEKVKEATGEDMDFTEMGISESVPQEHGEIESTAQAAVADKVEDDQGMDEKIEQAKAENEEEVPDELKNDDAKPSLDELAPAPSKNELFGDLDSIMNQYKEQQKALNTEQEMDKARQEGNLKEKLRQRRSRKMRLEAQGIQFEADNGPASE